MLRIAVCDDVAKAGEYTYEEVHKWALHKGIRVNINSFISGEELLADVEEYGSYQIYLLDICMDGMDGIETADRLRKWNSQASVIFQSFTEDRYKDAMRVYALTLINKPVPRQELWGALDQAYLLQEKGLESFHFQYNKVHYYVRLSEVLYFTSYGRQIQIRKMDGSRLEFYGKLDELEEELEDSSINFIRIHKSYYINFRHILSFHGNKLVMQDANEIPVSRSRRQLVRQLHQEYLAAL